jgi:hypothetical protein
MSYSAHPKPQQQLSHLNCGKLHRGQFQASFLPAFPLQKYCHSFIFLLAGCKMFAIRSSTHCGPRDLGLIF